VAGKREPGSNRGRTVVEWEHAFAFYAGLPEPQRCYRAVAERFGVSARTVERHAREGGWRERVRAIEKRAAEQTDQAFSEARAEERRKLARLIDATMVGYADKLRRGEIRMTPADLERLHRLREQLAPATDPTRTQEAQAVSGERSPEHVAAVLQTLFETGALDALGLRPAAAAASPDPEPEK
jgi:hypothetical protein